MMSLREKLVELIENGTCYARDCSRAYNCYAYSDVADYLIANGVTVQEWIPVTERFLSFAKIMDAPTIDAVEVVRCKDCKHRLYPTGMCSNPMAIGFDALEPTDFDFCSRGEREECT